LRKQCPISLCPYIVEPSTFTRIEAAITTTKATRANDAKFNTITTTTATKIDRCSAMSKTPKPDSHDLVPSSGQLHLQEF
jgi:hypothetical protein